MLTQELRSLVDETMDINERPIENVNLVLFPLKEDFTKETTLAVIVTNPKSATEGIADEIRDLFISKGFSRLYVLYLFTRIGELSEIIHLSRTELVKKGCDDAFRAVFPDVGKIVLAYGDELAYPGFDALKLRLEEVKKIAEETFESPVYYRVGEFTCNGNPKSLDQIRPTDELFSIA